jgi:phosphohistidine phosphatase
MMIWLLRHGDAEEAAEDGDAARRLTENGERQAEAAGRALEAIEADIRACLTSPKARARDMARIACRGLGVEVEETELLRGGDFDPHQVAGAAPAEGDRAGNVLLVGHEPDLSRAIEAVTGARVELKKGSLAAIDGGTLIALLTPAQLAAIARAR